MAFNLIRKSPSTALIPIDDVVDNLPFIVRRSIASLPRSPGRPQPSNGPRCAR